MNFHADWTNTLTELGLTSVMTELSSEEGIARNGNHAVEVLKRKLVELRKVPSEEQSKGHSHNLHVLSEIIDTVEKTMRKQGN
ncbi:hypothetical protein E4695_09180 [Alcaligenaceae bacterium 429]|uniref:hypothetical protein n=1 Tax=Paenalcaligenes sp. Me52 TaxID=3392038 RepID=UPI0010929515|nr:hypothetical protein E4695_09180 [Alcaligenaceae bacterium 429]